MHLSQALCHSLGNLVAPMDMFNNNHLIANSSLAEHAHIFLPDTLNVVTAGLHFCTVKGLFTGSGVDRSCYVHCKSGTMGCIMCLCADWSVLHTQLVPACIGSTLG